MVKKIHPKTFRAIKISKEALFEFIYENMINNQEEFMDVTDGTSIVSCFDINWETGDFIFLARNEQKKDENLQFPDEINTQLLMSKISDTVESMFNGGKRYVDLSLDEIVNIQNN